MNDSTSLESTGAAKHCLSDNSEPEKNDLKLGSHQGDSQCQRFSGVLENNENGNVEDANDEHVGYEKTQISQNVNLTDNISIESNFLDSIILEKSCVSGTDQITSEADCNNRSTPSNEISCESLASSSSSLSSFASLMTKDEKKACDGNETDELKRLCIHLQSVLDQQLKERERLQQKNEELSQQIKFLKDSSVVQQGNLSKDSPDGIQKLTENSSLKKELEALKMILETQGSKYNKEIASLTSSYTAKLDNLTRSYEECKKEKELMVIRYAQAESKNIELQESWKRAEAKMKECMKDRESIVARWNAMKMENNRIMKLLDAKDGELVSLKKDCDGRKETNNSREIQIKFLQQRIRQEQDALKESKEKVQEMAGRMASERVDCECLLNELKALLQANQMLQLTGSLPTLTQVMSRIELVISKKMEESVPKELWTDIFENLGSLVTLTNNLMSDNMSLKEKVKKLNQELSESEENFDSIRKRLEESEEERKKVESKLEEVEEKCQDMKGEVEKLRELTERSSELEGVNEELRSEMEVQSKRYSECLEYANKLSQVYASIQADNIRLNSEIESGTAEKEKLFAKCYDLEVENKHLIEQRFMGLRDLEEKVVCLERQLEQKMAEHNMLQIRYTDMEDELKSLRRQSAGRIKDLTRQLNKLNKNLRLTSPTPEYDSSGSSNFSDNGLLSTPNHIAQIATQSIDFPDFDEAKSHFIPHGARPITKKISFEGDYGLKQVENYYNMDGRMVDMSSINHMPSRNKNYRVQDPEVLCDEIQNCENAEVGYLVPPSVRVVEVNRQMFIDKIVSLQKTLAKKNERLDFLQELNSRLSQDIASKAKIIQNYILREETGVMSTNQSDRLKMQISKRGGIMASLFSSHPQDEAMTVDLALEISHKLQSVLEDTLLKNIALKESIELLGHQVAKLTKENESLKNRTLS